MAFQGRPDGQASRPHAVLERAALLSQTSQLIYGLELDHVSKLQASMIEVTLLLRLKIESCCC